MRVASRWLVDRGGLVVLVAFLIYAWVAPPHLSTGDNAEFATLGSLGGAAHPTGYPSYVLWLRLWSWLPAETPAHAAALATCVLGGASILVLHAACRAWGASRTAASFAVALAAAIPVVVRIHTEAEVFALNGLVAGAVLWLAAERGPLRGAWRAFMLGMVAGLGLADHTTCVLLAPIGVLGVVRGAREAESAPRTVGLAILGLAIGLLPYAYLVIVPETRGSWGKVEGLDGLLRHFLRMDYGGPGDLAQVDRGGTPTANIAALATSHLRGWLWGPFALGLVALALRCVRPAPAPSEPSVGWWMLAASWALAGIGLVSRFNLPTDGVYAFITQRFHVMPMLMFAVPVAAGLDLLGRRARLDTRRLARSVWAGAVGASLVAVALIGVSLPQIAGARSPALERSLQNTLRTLPPNAVLIGTPEETHFGMGYLQGVMYERPDVTIISWPQVGLAYARARIQRQIGVTIEALAPGSEEKLSVVVARQVLATGRPLFIDPYQANIATSFPVYPYGLVYRVLPSGAATPSLDELFSINDELYKRFELGYPNPSSADVVPAEIHRNYARPWQVIADAMRTAGNREKHQYAMQMVLALEPEE